jgi:hypothetical protein
LILATFSFFTKASAQTKYGGSAYAYVEDAKGNKRVINEASDDLRSTSVAAKQKLQNNIETQVKFNERLISGISYTIDIVDVGNIDKYAGTASVKVKEENGNIKVINEAVSCSNQDIPTARINLLNRLLSSVKYNETVISPISYDIDRCN